MKVIRTLPDCRTDAMSVSGVCVPLSGARSIASTALCGSGDGLQPSQLGSLSPSRSAHPHVLGRSALSYRAIAAALALEDVSVGERLVAYSLASYAGRDHLAWPAARTAAVRAGLSRRQYLAARAVLVERGLVIVEEVAGRPAGSTVVRLRFAEDGLSIERESTRGCSRRCLPRRRSRAARGRCSRRSRRWRMRTGASRASAARRSAKPADCQTAPTAAHAANCSKARRSRWRSRAAGDRAATGGTFAIPAQPRVRASGLRSRVGRQPGLRCR
jgi:hypothetical protein